MRADAFRGVRETGGSGTLVERAGGHKGGPGLDLFLFTPLPLLYVMLTMYAPGTTTEGSCGTRQTHQRELFGVHTQDEQGRHRQIVVVFVEDERFE